MREQHASQEEVKALATVKDTGHPGDYIPDPSLVTRYPSSV